MPIGGFPYRREEWQWASAWLPLVGTMVGASLAIVWTLLAPAGALSTAAVTVTLGILITGALHEDGLADTADALGGATTRERLFEILKDSRVGSYGAIAIVLSVVLRVTLLAELGGRAPAALIITSAVARCPPVWLMAMLPYVTADTVSKSRDIARGAWPQAIVATLTVLLLLGACGFAGMLSLRGALGAMAAATATGAICAWRFAARAGGVTGDFLGAAEQVGECAVLLSLSMTA